MSTGVQAFYDRKYAEGTELPRSSKRFTLDCVPAEGPLEVLDVGCGAGINSQAIRAKGHRVTGVDISAAAVEKYRALGFPGRVMDLEEGLAFADGAFDLVFCSEVIEHLRFPETLVHEVFRVLRPGGRLVLSTPNSAFWLYRLFAILGYTVSELQHPKHFQFFSRRSLRRLLRAEGFSERAALGRNMYLIVPDPPAWARPVVAALGFEQERRFRTGTSFWHFSAKSRFCNGFFADTLIVVADKWR
jgi:2-polyprenyl-3-methyl-5-hydroxy-6-metoxy-1,4-benzoquinol methylase